MVNQSALCMYVYCSVWNILDSVENAYFSGKNKIFKLSGNLYGYRIYMHCLETPTRELFLCVSIGDISMEFDLCDKDDVHNCLEEILKIPDKFN